MTDARVVRVAGALLEARPLAGASLYELVRVGEAGLLGEVIRLDGDRATIQVFEETAGLSLDEPVEPTGETLTIELGPGLVGSVLDGVGRSLSRLAERQGPFLQRGAFEATLDRDVRYAFAPSAARGDEVAGGDVLGTVEERPGLPHPVLVPNGVAGTIEAIEEMDVSVDEPFGSLADGTPLTLLRRWPVRRPRPVAERLAGDRPFVTGQRVFDLLFPVAEGGSVAVPGGFGTGKTIIEQSLARYGDADVVVYVGCGERGNEMAGVLEEFPDLEDPRTGRPVMDRTVLVVNTSNMPVVAREASVLLGITIAEYYRDLGYRVSVMADSLSRWAEALREISSRLREMPGEEGYPTSMADRLGKVYERSGRARTLGRPDREGAVTIIGAVSPPGGDFSEPVTQACLRVAGGLWALDTTLANQRHFPAVDWDTSYSLYADRVAPWFAERAGDDWSEVRRDLLSLLQQERELREIAGLVGPGALEDADRLTLESARLVREIVLAQSAFDPADAFSPVPKTYHLAALALAFHREAGSALDAGRPFESIDVVAARRALERLRGAKGDDVERVATEARASLVAAARGETSATEASSSEPEPSPETGVEA